MTDQWAASEMAKAFRDATGAAVCYLAFPDGTCVISSDEAMVPDSEIPALFERAAEKAQEEVDRQARRCDYCGDQGICPECQGAVGWSPRRS